MKMVEHIFVTRKTWAEARGTLAELFKWIDLSVACSCLGCGGGDDPTRLDLLEAACPRCQNPRKITFSNGVERGEPQAGTLAQPLWLSVEFNRGRVEMAAAVERAGPPSKNDEEILQYFARFLEEVLNDSISMKEAVQSWRKLR